MMRWCGYCVRNTWHFWRQRSDGVQTLCCDECRQQLPPMPRF